jgi:uncharacterized protein
VVLIFNCFLAVADFAVLALAAKTRSLLAWCIGSALAAVAGLMCASLMRYGAFGSYSLAAWGVFCHGSILLGGAAVIFRRTHRIVATVCGASVLGLLGVAADAFLIEPTWLEVSHVEITSPKLTRRWRIVVVADLQTDSIGQYERDVLRRVAEEKPDLILFAGDYIQTVDWDEREPLIRELNTLLRETNFGTHVRALAVQGNADLGDWTQIFDNLDQCTAVERTESFDMDGLRVTCLGLNSTYTTRVKVPEAPLDTFHIVLGHVPNFALSDGSKADLLVAGHTHGGQVRLPFLGATITHSKIPRRWAAGVTDLPQGGKLLVSRGIGMEREYAPRFRFLCRPELVVVDLVPEGQ